ncbi:hypothetical protein JCM8208_001351 [Rhodotorula glutinis]
MSDAPKGRGRGRGRRIAATTLSGPLASASPSASPAPPPPPPPHANNPDTDNPDATDDAPATSAPPPAPQRRASVKRVASVGVGSTRAPSVGSSMSRTPSLGPNAASTPAPERAARPVGGLLAVNSEYRAQATGPGASAGARPKFKPNMRRSLKVQDDDDDEDVKMEDGDSFRNKRGPRAPRARQDLEMTASGPMAQGPGGPPRAWGAGRPQGAGASGAAVMAASRAGTLNRMLDDDSDASDLEGGGGSGGSGGSGDEGAHVRRFKAVDLNDIGGDQGAGARDGEDEAVTPLTLPRDPKVLRTKIRRLQERKAERVKREARHAAKAQGLVKPEPTDDALPASTSTSTSATPLGGTPAPSAIAPSTAASLIGGAGGGTDSKEGSLALLSVDEDKEAKDLKDLEEEEKKEISLSEAFDLAPETRGELYMFQFPRKFPVFTPESSTTSTTATAAAGAAAGAASTSSSSVKPDPDAPAAPPRKPAAPAWGRFGSRAEKASRWTEHEGRIGQLRVHQSGKVTLRIQGDLRYEVLPAAQPSFLQEVAILDHRTAAGSATAAVNGNGNGHTNGASAKTKKPKHRRRSSSSGSSGSSSSSSSSTEPSRPKGRPVPAESLVVLGQTQKKFLVVPDINDLLASVAQQEKDERDEERRVKLERARGASGAAAAAGGGKGRR